MSVENEYKLARLIFDNWTAIAIFEYVKALEKAKILHLAFKRWKISCSS